MRGVFALKGLQTYQGMSCGREKARMGSKYCSIHLEPQNIEQSGGGTGVVDGVVSPDSTTLIFAPSRPDEGDGCQSVVVFNGITRENSPEPQKNE